MKLSDLRSAEAVHQEDMADDPGYRKEYLKSRFANQVAAKMIRWRTEHDLTQAKLADLVGMRQPNIARLESGEHTPSLETLGRISSQLGIKFSIDIDPENGISLGESRPAGEAVEDATSNDELTELLERIRAISRSLWALQVVADDQAGPSETHDPGQGGRGDFERALAGVLERFRERSQLRRPGSWKAADVVGLLDSGQEVLLFEAKSHEDLHTLSVSGGGGDTPPGRSAATRRQELGAFLRSRRERISPGEVGIRATSSRRTSGLRREEVAELASVGVTWYTWLEQGRRVRASPQVLVAISNALLLSPSERAYLLDLAEADQRLAVE